MTPEEKTLIQAELSKYIGSGHTFIEQELNKDGSSLDEKWETISTDTQHINVHKAVLLAAMSPTERAGLRKALAADEDFKMLYEAAEEFTINHPTTIAMINGLVAGIGLKSEVATGILRLGQRKISRAEELIGRKITQEEIEEARNA
jgi:hypothetical protein